MFNNLLKRFKREKCTVNFNNGDGLDVVNDKVKEIVIEDLHTRTTDKNPYVYKKADDKFDYSKTIIKIRPVIDPCVIQEAYRMTSNSDREFTISDEDIYETLHSPVRCMIFWIKMYNIPNCVSVHLVRHAHHTPFVKTGREDRHGLGDKEHRYSCKDHGMFINAETLINIAKKRLCNKALGDVSFLMYEIREGIREYSEHLANKMVPNCVAMMRCPESKGSCRQIDKMIKLYGKKYFATTPDYCLPKVLKESIYENEDN
jgi:hypothetical protein